jgi:copper chaperone CopZ
MIVAQGWKPVNFRAHVPCVRGKDGIKSERLGCKTRGWPSTLEPGEYIMKKLVWWIAAAVLFGPVQGRAESVKLQLHGVRCAGCAGALTEALSKVPSVKVVEKPTKKTFSTTALTVIDLDLGKADVGELAKAIADAETPHRLKEAPSSFLILEAPKLSKANAKAAVDALKAVRGVDVRESAAEVKTKQIHVKLDRRGGARLADIQRALADYLRRE